MLARMRAARKIEVVKMPKKSGLWLALGVFLLTAGLGVAINSTVFGRGLRLGWSISRYVGSETWSAVIFALGNFLVVAMVGKYLWKLGDRWHMLRVYYYCAFLMCLGLILLSIFPVGYFDVVVNGVVEKSVISYAHEISSRVMFVMMMLMAAMLAGNWRACAQTRAVCVAYLVYAVFCVTGYLTAGSWFTPLILIYESVYIAAFPLVLIACLTNKKLRG